MAAQEVDPGLPTVPDSIFQATSQPGPVYQSVYDQNKTRSNWTQSLSYGRTNGRTAISLMGTTTAQRLLHFRTRSTFGDVDARIDARLTPRWLFSIGGHYNMESSIDKTEDRDRRENKAQFRTQYSWNPFASTSLSGSAYTEFQRFHSLKVTTEYQDSTLFPDPDAVDSLLVTRDSSYTTGRQDGLSGTLTWKPRPWFDFYGTAAGSRVRPTHRSVSWDFHHPLDGSGGGRMEQRRDDPLSEPSDNSSFTSRFTYTGLPRTTATMDLSKSELDQSSYQSDLRSIDQQSFSRNSGSFHVSHGPYRGFMVTLDGALSRSAQEAHLRRETNKLVHTRQLSAVVGGNDSISLATLGFTVDRTRLDRQINSARNGLVINRALNGNAARRLTRKLRLDGAGSISLQRFQFTDPSGDYDNARSSLTVGGAYLVSAPCSTSVHFSRVQSHLINVDPSISSANSAQTSYVMNATMLLTLGRGARISQNYALRADYKVYDYVESNNFLNRSRSIETDFVDTLLSFAYVRLKHTFQSTELGAYRRDPGEDQRTFRISTEEFNQTLATTIGLVIAEGVRAIATQGLLNRRTYSLSTRQWTNHNRFELTGSLEVNRTFAPGVELSGAVRHVGGYDERLTPQTNTSREDYWIVGATVQKTF